MAVLMLVCFYILSREAAEATEKLKDVSGNIQAGQVILVDAGHGVPGRGSQDLRVQRHLTPAQKGDPLLAADDLEELLGLAALQILLGEEEHTNAVVPLLPQVESKGAVELVGHLQQHADAVAYLPGGILTGPVLQPLHNGQCIVHHIVAGNAVDIHNGTDAAGIVLETFGI